MLHAFHILHVGPAPGEPELIVTAALAASTAEVIMTALSEQLDRVRAAPIDAAGDVVALRERATLQERFEPARGTGKDSVVSFTAPQLRTCVLELSQYVGRVDVDGYQPLELRERLSLLREVIAELWDANATAAGAAMPAGAVRR